jgi:flavin reductase (DIM6/NTAB) family NADH-FMN oxidoreductase RutF
MGRFFRKHPPGTTAFDGLAVEHAAGGTPVLADALAWLECRLSGEHDAGDHVVVFGDVTDGKLQRQADPLIHLRKSGAIY